MVDSCANTLVVNSQSSRLVLGTGYLLNRFVHRENPTFASRSLISKLPFPAIPNHSPIPRESGTTLRYARPAVKYLILVAIEVLKFSSQPARGGDPVAGEGTLPSTIPAPVVGPAPRRTTSSSDIHPSRCLGTSVGTQSLGCCLSTYGGRPTRLCA